MLMIDEIIKVWTAACEDNGDPADETEVTEYRTQMEALNRFLADFDYSDPVGYVDLQELHQLTCSGSNDVPLIPEPSEFPCMPIFLVHPEELLKPVLLELCRRAERFGSLNRADILDYAGELFAEELGRTEH